MDREESAKSGRAIISRLFGWGAVDHEGMQVDDANTFHVQMKHERRIFRLQIRGLSNIDRGLNPGGRIAQDAGADSVLSVPSRYPPFGSRKSSNRSLLLSLRRLSFLLLPQNLVCDNYLHL